MKRYFNRIWLENKFKNLFKLKIKFKVINKIKIKKFIYKIKIFKIKKLIKNNN
jgi:hypothetical protein